jgi:hypothetical protein
VVGNNRIAASKTSARHSRPQHVGTSNPSHPVLQLQRQIGNRAVVALLKGSGGYPLPAAALLSVQRQGEAALEEGAVPAPLIPPLLLSERQRLAAQAPPVLKQVVDAMPQELGPEVAAPGRVEEARREADVVAEDLPRLLPRSPALASWLSAQQDGGAGPPVEAQRMLVQELGAGKEEVAEPAPAKPGRLSQAGRAVQGFFGGFGSKLSGWGSAIKRTFSRENRRDAGAKTPTVGGIGGPAVAHVNYAVAAGRGLVDNPATEASARLVGGAKAADQVRDTGGQIGQVAHSASPTTTTLEHPGEFAHSFTAGGFELAHQIAGMAGIFFSALKAALDIRSLVSSIRVLRDLKKAKNEATKAADEFWGDPEAKKEVVAMVDYAIRQKYEKVIKRAIGTVTALAALGTALAILIANPVGASLAAIIIGGLGASVFVYKIGRWAWKKWKTESLGKKRGEIARKLHAQISLGDSLAIEAVRALHLDPDVVASAPNGAALIRRKLKSS